MIALLYDMVDHGTACSCGPAPTHQHKTSKKMTFVYLNAAAGSAVWSSSGTFPEAKTFHYVIHHSYSAQNFALPFHPCKLFPLPLYQQSPFLSILPYRILFPFPSASLSTGFMVPDFQSSFGLDNSHLYFSIPLISPLFSSKANTQICCIFGIASSVSLWHLTLYAIFFSFCHYLSSLSVLLSRIYPLGKKTDFLT